MPLDRRTLRVELARRDLTQTRLAGMLGVPPTSLSTWLRGEHPAPPDLKRKIETALGLSAGTLDADPEERQ